jgi:hypothetical protein
MLVATNRSDPEVSDTKKTTRINWDDYKNKPNSFSIIIPISKSAPADIEYISYITN